MLTVDIRPGRDPLEADGRVAPLGREVLLEGPKDVGRVDLATVGSHLEGDELYYRVVRSRHTNMARPVSNSLFFMFYCIFITKLFLQKFGKRSKKKIEKNSEKIKINIFTKSDFKFGQFRPDLRKIWFSARFPVKNSYGQMGFHSARYAKSGRSDGQLKTLSCLSSRRSGLPMLISQCWLVNRQCCKTQWKKSHFRYNEIKSKTWIKSWMLSYQNFKTLNIIFWVLW